MIEVANPEQYEAWNGDSGRRWVAGADRRDLVLAPVAEALLAAADPTAGEAVLDVGCGCGATTLASARAVTGAGHATGVDLSAPMLAVARERARRAALDNTTFLQLDAQSGPIAPADLVISRFGTMFFSDPELAFSHLRRALDGNGRMCLATWQPLAVNEWLTVPGAALLRFATLPDGDATRAGMFSQAEPEVVRATLHAAGFTRVDLDAVTVPLRLGGTIEEAIEHLVDSGPGRAALDAVPRGHRPAALDAVRAVLDERASPDGVELNGAIWIVGAA
jgi:ubiquinone/menaquinone biosynthesis C-methylase UbiE